ncbi:MAG TPA: redoxin domain-containing protein, partial [Anaerolineae bacterium]|nr:redoxin domain-containing protein [Anaerolineae bacterium]
GKGKNDLAFVLLSDPEHEVAETYGVWGEKKMYGKTFMGIIRSHFVIDEEGKVVDVQIEFSPKKTVELAVAALWVDAGETSDVARTSEVCQRLRSC